MSTVVICGNSYELTNEPIHGVVRALKEKQKSITFEFLFKNKDIMDDKMTIDQAVEVIARQRPEVFSAYDNALQEFDLVGSISLATSHLFSDDELFNVKENELKEIYVKCCEALGGGGMKYFFGDVKKNTSSVVKEAPMKKILQSPEKPSKNTSTKVVKPK
jgi:hypothetical protein